MMPTTPSRLVPRIIAQSISTVRPVLLVLSLVGFAASYSGAQPTPPPDGVGFIGDTLHPQISGASFSNAPGGEPSLSSDASGPSNDIAVDRANRQLYALTRGGLKIYQIQADGSSPTLVPVTTIASLTGTHLALSLDARTAYIGAKGSVTAVNLYPESVFRSGRSVLVPAYTDATATMANKRIYELAPKDRNVVAMGVHPAGDRLIVVTEAIASKVNVNNDLLRSDVGNGTRANALIESDLPSDFGYITQLDISNEAQTSGVPRAAREFVPSVGIKELIYPDAVAVGIKSLAFSPDGNYALLAAVGGQTVRATPFGILPTTDEGTGGIVVLDVRPTPAATSSEPDAPVDPWVRYLGFIPTTERDENTTELRAEIRTEGWKIVHPEVQWARLRYLSAQGASAVGGMTPFTALPTLSVLTVASEVLGLLEGSFKDYGYMQAYFNLYPRDMVGASGVAINHRGDFGIVTLQDTNNLGLLSLSLSPALAGYSATNLPDFYVKTGTGKSINGFDAALTTGNPGYQPTQWAYGWAYPQEVAFTSDSSRIFIGMAGGTPKADLNNKFGSANALVLLAERDRPDSIFKNGTPPPGYELYQGDAFRSPRRVATRQSFDADADADQLSDQLEALNRWNALRTIPAAQKPAMISTSDDRMTNPAVPLAASAFPDDALDKSFFLPTSGIGYRFDSQGQPPLGLNAGSRSAVAAIEKLGRLWHDAFLAGQVSRPYFVVGVIAAPGGGILKNADGEPLQYGSRNGFQVNFPYMALDAALGQPTDAVHDFVTSNGPASPRDNSIENVEGFDAANAKKFLELLLAENAVAKIEIDPAVRDQIAGVNFADARFAFQGVSDSTSRERRDLDTQMSVSFSPLAVKIAVQPAPEPTPDAPLVPGRHTYEVTLPPHLNRDTMKVWLPNVGEPGDFIVRTPSLDGVVVELGKEYTLAELLSADGSLILMVDSQNAAKEDEFELTLEVLSPELDNVYSLRESFEYIQWSDENDPRRQLTPIDTKLEHPTDQHGTVVKAELVNFSEAVRYRSTAWKPAPNSAPTEKPSPATIDESTGKITAGKDSGILSVQAFSTTPGGTEVTTRVLDIEVGACGPCATGSCPLAGSIHLGMGSMRFEVGDGDDGKVALWRETAGAELTQRRSLRYPYHDKDTRVIYDAEGALRQVLTAEVLMDIRPRESGYVIETYKRDGTPVFNSALALYEVANQGAPISSLTVEPDSIAGDNGALLTKIEDGATERHAFRYSPADSEWTFVEHIDQSTGNGRRQQRIANTTAVVEEQSVTLVTRTMTDDAGEVVSKVVETFADLAAGRRLISRVVDPDGVAQATNYTYDARGLVESIVYPDGRWERFTYDASERLTKHVEPWLNAAFDALDSACVVTTYDYTPLVEAEGAVPMPDAPRTTIVTTLGVETSRTYDHYETDVHHSIMALEPGAAWNHSSNLVTTQRFVSSGDFAGRVASLLSPDGTMTFYSYAGQDGGGEVTTISRGAPNVELSGIADGTTTTTITNRHEREISSTTVDVASGLVIDRRLAIETDDGGRPLTWSYLDGSTSSTSYGCCGVESETDRSGLTTSYEYDAFKRVSMMHRQGVSTRYEYDAAGRLLKTSRRGSDGSIILTERTDYLDIAGESVDTFDALGRKTQSRTAYNANGTTTQTTTLPGGFTQWQIVARDGRPLETGGTAAAPMRYEYRLEQLAGVPFSVTRTIARVFDETTSEYRDTEWTETWSDMGGRSLRLYSADGAYAESFYNEKGQLVRTADPDGVTTLFAYNARGEQHLTVLDADRDGTVDYAGEDRITRTARGYVTKEWGDQSISVARTTTEIWATSETDLPLVVTVQEQSVDGLHAWSSQFDAVTHQETRYPAVRDGSWEVVSTAPDQTSSVAAYAGGRLATTTAFDRDGVQLGQTTYGYDPHGRTRSVTDARTGATTYTYYDDDQVESITVPHPEVAAQLLVTTSFYNDRGLLERRRLPDLSETSYTYTPQGQLDRVQGSQSYPLDYDYDSQGRMIRMTTWQDFAADEGQAVTTWRYDSQRGQLQAKRYADGNEVGYTYTPGGRLGTRTWARGLVTAYAYRSDGALASVDYSDATPDIAYSYHRHGQVQEVRDGLLVDGEIDEDNLRFRHEYAFDAALRPTTETIETFGSHQLTRRYEGSAVGEVPGRYRGYTLGDTAGSEAIQSIDYAYDAAGRLHQVISPAGTFTYGYLLNSGLIETTTGPVHTARNTYQPFGNGISARANTVGETVVSRFAYTTNALGQRTAVVNSGTAFGQPRHFAYNYNDKGEVVAGKRFEGDNLAQPGTPILPETFAYGFDDIGNRKQAVRGESTAPLAQQDYVANPLNQYTNLTVSGSAPSSLGISASTFVHDADGNLTDDARWHYTWNAENRLIAMETQPAAVLVGNPRQRLEFAYDRQGRRVAKTVSAWAGSQWSVVSDLRFIYDGWNLLAEFTLSSQPSTQDLARTYAWGIDVSGSLQGAGGVGGLLGVSEIYNFGISHSHFPTYDANGNISEYLDQTGNVSTHLEYGPFGETLRATGTFPSIASFRFSTKYTDTETDLFYYGLRYYSPFTGRWPVRDPIGEEGGVNLYNFIANNPANGSDVLGLALYAFDGTGNNNREVSKGKFTWVLVLAQGYGGEAHYENGVGSSFGTRIIGGLTGWGGRARLENAYQAFLRNYKNGDKEIDIVGFSRGAAMAREFANMIYERGDGSGKRTVTKQIGRISTTRTVWGKPCKIPEIRYIGLFDSVGSFGAPGNHANIGYNLKLPPNVRIARQAVAADEQRYLFPLTPLTSSGDAHDLGERRFPGDHSDIGRGHGSDTRDLSYAPLEYIWSEGIAVGVPFGPLPGFHFSGNTTPHDLSSKFPHNIFPKRPR
jgi:RHS repeat-associated protein